MWLDRDNSDVDRDKIEGTAMDRDENAVQPRKIIDKSEEMHGLGSRDQELSQCVGILRRDKKNDGEIFSKLTNASTKSKPPRKPKFGERRTRYSST